MNARTLLLGSLALLPAASASAQGYCLATTDPPAKCGEPCVETGEPLYWGEKEIVYTFNRRGFSGVDEALVRDTFAQAFATWEAVSCDDEGALGFRFQEHSEDTDLQVGPHGEEPNQNVIWMATAEEWQALKYDPRAYAVTQTWFDVSGREIGRLRGADMTFNPSKGPWGLCPAERCEQGNDLLSVATHEVGHVLGLSHSDAVAATMECSAADGQTYMRSLEADDIDGLCAIYGPDGVRTLGAYPRPPADEKCSVGHSARPSRWLLGLCALSPLMLLVRRRRTRRTR